MPKRRSRFSYILGPLYWDGLTLIQAWINNHIPGKVWDEITYLLPNFNGYILWNEITYPFPHLNGYTVEVWELISNFIL